MPDKETIKDEQTTPRVIHETPDTPERDNMAHSPYSYPRRRTGWIIGVVGGVVVLGCLVFFGTALFVVSHANRLAHVSTSSNQSLGNTGPSQGFYGRGGFNNGGGSSSMTAGQSRLSGVVTAVNGSTLTVAGDGQSTQVTVSSSTTYSGAAQPAAVNDSITVFGTAGSNNTFTATAVRLSRQQ